MTRNNITLVRGTFAWTAVFIAVLIGTGLAFLLNLFNLAVGLAAFTTSPEGITTLTIGGLIALAIGVFIMTFITGFIAAYLGNPVTNHAFCDGIFYGFTAWALTLLLSIFLTAQLGDFFSASTTLISSTPYNNHTATTLNNTPLVFEAAPLETPTTKLHQDEINKMGIAVLALFFLFLTGAAASCLGGYYGIVRNVYRQQVSLN